MISDKQINLLRFCQFIISPFKNKYFIVFNPKVLSEIEENRFPS